ncbi:hypothetical protein [Neofamilia massiliensis]|uniref:hypothetical protein n=1 Tax=Neofamilia massiliensis TaxID=1673724 RepID=UPI0006BB757A|nr:hypothetical protein [Neofamilia massiliensis]
MKKDIDLIVNELYKTLNQGRDIVMTQVSEMSDYCQQKKEIKKLEDQLEIEFREIGVLSYELYKMDVAYSFDDFKRKFKKISELQRQLKEIKIDPDNFNKSQRPSIDKNLIEEKMQTAFSDKNLDQEQMTRCKACGKANSIYVAYCSSCDEKLE